MPDSSTFRSPARLLKGAAVLALTLGALLIAWLIDKAIRYPEIKASQLGSVAPLWVPFAIFVGVCVVLIAGLFWYAAGRVEAGEDLFAQRHRRRPGDEEA